MIRRLYSSLLVYIAKKKREAIQHTLTGIGVTTLIVELVHKIHFIELNQISAILISSLIGAVPFVVDFAFFHMEEKKVFQKMINQLEGTLNRIMEYENEDLNEIVLSHLENEINLYKKFAQHKDDIRFIENLKKLQNKLVDLEVVIEGAFNKNNRLIENSAFSRLDKEITIIKDLTKNRAKLPALQNFEYIREILGRVIQKVMEPGDHYITLSRLDFWSTEPLDKNKIFMKANIESSLNQQKYIHRAIVLEKDLLKKNKELSFEMLQKKEALLNVLKNFDDAGKYKYNYFANLKLLFFFTDDYSSFEDYLLSAIVLKDNLRDVSFIQVKDLNDIEKINPYIRVKYHELDDVLLQNKDKTDIVKIISALIECIAAKKNNDPELSELQQFLRIYRTCFQELNNIYNTDNGVRIKNINIEQCSIFDLNMLRSFYEL